MTTRLFPLTPPLIISLDHAVPCSINHVADIVAARRIAFLSHGAGSVIQFAQSYQAALCDLLFTRTFRTNRTFVRRVRMSEVSACLHYPDRTDTGM